MRNRANNRIITVICGCLLMAACGGERRVEGEMAFDPGSLMTMAESFLKAGDYSNAMRLYQRAATESPTHVPSRLGLAKTYQALGATDAALNFYDQVLRLDPANLEAKLGTGQMLITKNRPRDAIPFLSELSKSDPENYRIFNMLGLAHDLLGEQEDAQMNYGRGLELVPDNISLLNNLALSFAFEEQYAPAIKLLSKAINLDYTVTKAQQNLVLVYVLSGEEEAGRQIGAGLMTEEEMVNNIRHYNWVKTLPAAQRAQAIYLGIKNFPLKSDQSTGRERATSHTTAPQETSTDPKKAQLQALLAKEAELTDHDGTPRTDAPLRQGPPQNIRDTQEGEMKGAQAADGQPVEAAPPTPVTDYAPVRYRHRVQLGAYPSVAVAEAGWDKLKGRSGGLLEPYTSLVKLVTLADGRTLFRLFVGGIEDKSLAETTCTALQEENVDCLVLRTVAE
ncbi:SPOR domain-containing protein [Paremcibacter congregatus]|uniref:SPOR domain-containing protein n=1 Tax=Paremcibacter congregatus TaxID=2043170 RepID=UPI0030EBB20F